MNAHEFWITTVLMGAFTFALRFVPIALLERFRLPQSLEHALRFVPVAVLSAVIAPHLFTQAGQVHWGPRTLAGLVAGLVAWRTRNMLLTIVAGMVVVWALGAWR